MAFAGVDRVRSGRCVGPCLPQVWPMSPAFWPAWKVPAKAGRSARCPWRTPRASRCFALGLARVGRPDACGGLCAVLGRPRGESVPAGTSEHALRATRETARAVIGLRHSLARWGAAGRSIKDLLRGLARAMQVEARAG